MHLKDIVQGIMRNLFDIKFDNGHQPCMFKAQN